MAYARQHTQVNGTKGVTTLEDFAQYLEKAGDSNNLVHKSTDPKKQDLKLDHAVVRENGRVHVILIATALLSLLCPGSISHLDATFGSRPLLKKCTQLLTLMVRAYNKVSFLSSILIYIALNCIKVR